MTSKMRVGIGSAVVVTVGVVAAAVVTGFFGLFARTTPTTQNTTTVTASNVQNSGIIGNNNTLTLEAPKSETIPGTKITHSELRDTYPFGYVIFYTTENQRFRYEVFKTGKLEWEIDWNNVKIEPNFSTGWVQITIPPISAIEIDATGHTNNTLHFNNFVHTMNVPLKVGGYGGPYLFGTVGQPIYHPAVLSVNQRSPVFAIGFRLQPKE